EVFLNKEVVEEVTDARKQIHLDEARKISAAARVGDKVGIRLDTKEFGRIAAQKAKNIIRQGIRDSEKGQALADFESKRAEIVTVIVEQIDKNTGNANVRLGKSIAVLSKNEQVNGETLNEGDAIKVYVLGMKPDNKESRAIVSRTHPDFVKKLFEAEVPEIFEGVVEIKSISREAGSRTKIAVLSHDENVDAVGACIGPRGQRVSTIVSALNGEKIDIIEYDEDDVKFVSASLSPAEVKWIDIDPRNEKTCRAVVPDNQLSLAIGNKGQNVRLAAKLTGWKIDIRPESNPYDDEEDDDEAVDTTDNAPEEADNNNTEAKDTSADSET
ncbi:MAG: transcription termination/antitermination protein NusA, partial [Clostridia bacterium]|nr:transcription termination/antitermination protein NusA [Clostridia bacterium]